MPKLTLIHANAIIETAFIVAKKLALRPMTVVVLDDGGHLIALQRQDGAALLRFDIAFAKAYGSLGMGIGSRGLALKAKESPDFINGAIAATKGKLIPAPGGVIILNDQKEIIGAVGASGDSSDNDERIIVAGITDLGFTAKVD